MHFLKLLKQKCSDLAENSSQIASRTLPNRPENKKTIREPLRSGPKRRNTPIIAPRAAQERPGSVFLQFLGAEVLPSGPNIAQRCSNRPKLSQNWSQSVPKLRKSLPKKVPEVFWGEISPISKKEKMWKGCQKSRFRDIEI